MTRRADGHISTINPRPVLRWHGGKWKLAPWIISHFPSHRIYVEPYGGAASVLVRKERCYAEIYNDVDDEVVNLFRVLRDDRLADNLVSQIRMTPFARNEFAQSITKTHDPVERARRLCIRSLMGFGSNGHNIKRKTGFRSKSHTSGTTPSRVWANYPNEIHLIIERLRGVVIENKNAIDVMKEHDSYDTLHYVDPPYVLSSRASSTPAYHTEMTNDDHREMARCLHSLRGMVVLSGYPSDLYNELFGGWHFITRTALADGAARRTEVLWFNAAAWSSIHDESLFAVKKEQQP